MESFPPSNSRTFSEAIVTGDLADLKTRISSSTVFAFSELLITVLKLDLYRDDDTLSRNFSYSTLELIFSWNQFADKTCKILKTHFEDGSPLFENLTSLIETIKKDTILHEFDPSAKNGSIYLMESFLIHILKSGCYDSRYRVLLKHISSLLGVLWDDFENFEEAAADQLLESYNETEESCNKRTRIQKLKKYKRRIMIGAAGGIGGILVGLTGGLAAPLVATGITTFAGAIGVAGATAALSGLTTTAGAIIFGTAFGVAGAGLSGYRMNKRVGAIEEFVIENLSNEANSTLRHSLHCVLVVSGFIGDNNEIAFKKPWRHLWQSNEQYTLRWEGKYLEELGKAIEYILSYAVSIAIQRSLMETVLAGLMSAIAWPLALLGSSSIIDNPWNVCTRRATEVGEYLAELLLARKHGCRPITLIGYSLGARVIYHCLLALSKRENSLGIVEDAILLGAPVTASGGEWKQVCSVVGGRVINGYCETDWLLRFLYRTMSMQLKIAGTSPITFSERKIVNLNLTHIVKGHMDYSKKLTAILNSMGIKVTPLSQSSRIDLETLEDEQRKITEIEIQNKSQEGSQSLTSDSSIYVEHCKPIKLLENSHSQDSTDPLNS